MIGKKYKARYNGIVPKGYEGTCVDILNNAGVYALKIKFPNQEEFWFMYRDVEKVSK